MHIALCPDKFAGTLSASEASEAIMQGWRRVAPKTEFSIVPISDGGFGFLDSISTALDLENEQLLIRDLQGNERLANYAFNADTAYIEVAQAIGIHFVSSEKLSPLDASSYGVGQIIKTVVDKGFRNIVIGLGGTGTSDGGAGVLAALGAVAYDKNNNVINALENGPSNFLDIAKIDLNSVENFLTNINIEILTDVENPLLGSRGTARVFGKQKGADEKQIEEIELALTHLARLLGKRKDGKNAAVSLGAGAAGGLGFLFMRLGAKRSAGIDRVSQILQLQEIIENADLVITGEGKFDWQSLDGKAVSGVAKLAMSLGKPVLVLAGQVEIGRRDWQTIGVSSAVSLAEFCGLDEAISNSAASLMDLSERVARTWNR